MTRATVAIATMCSIIQGQRLSARPSVRLLPGAPDVSPAAGAASTPSASDGTRPMAPPSNPDDPRGGQPEHAPRPGGSKEVPTRPDAPARGRREAVREVGRESVSDEDRNG